MTIALQPEQEQFIQSQLKAGNYRNAADVITEALRLLEKRDRYDRWVVEMRDKVDVVVAQLDRGEGVDGETAIAALRAKLYQGQIVQW